MIKTRIVEVAQVNGQTVETELGYTLLAEVPIEKKAPPVPKDGELPPSPLVVRVNGEPFFVIGHTWDMTASREISRAEAATLVLIVQKLPSAPSIVRAPSGTLDKLKLIIPEPGISN